MDKLEIITTPLLFSEREVLLSLVSFSNRIKSRVIPDFSVIGGLLALHGGSAEKKDLINLDLPRENEWESSILHLRALDQLGFIFIKDERGGGTITILPAGYTRAKHERRWQIWRWLEIARLRQGRNIAFYAFILSLALAVIRILEFFNSK